MKLRRPALALALTVLAGLAAAETSPYYFGVSQGFSHDANVYRLGDRAVLPAGLQRSDTVSTSSLLAGLDQPLGRGRLFGSAALRASRFSDNDGLNNQSYNANLGLDWASVDHLSGTLSAAATQSLARFNPDNDVPTVFRKNVERTQQVDARIRLGVVTRWTAEANVGWRQVDYSADEFRSRAYEQGMVSAGLRYRPSAALTLGTFARYTDGRFAQYRALGGGGFQADEFQRQDLDLTGAWVPSAASTLNARLTLSRVDHSQAVRRDFSGATGLLRWQWKPSGKLGFNTVLSRDTGEETAFLDYGTSQILASDAFSRSITQLRINADYELSAKVQLGLGTAWTRRSLADTFTFGSGVALPREGGDTGSMLSLNARWAPLRSLLLSCDVSRDRRTSAGALSDAYSVTVYGCTGQFMLQ